MNTIYYLEDDADIRNLVVYALNATGFKAQGFETGAAFCKALREKLPDLILLDVMLPDVSGFELLSALRTQPETRNVPVIMLTARDAEDDRVDGLSLGADDYVPKPFGVMELVARVRAVLRRCCYSEEAKLLRCGEIVLDASRHTVIACGRNVRLTLKEFSLLQILMENAGRLVDRNTMTEQVWDSSNAEAGHTLDSHMRTLRAKLGDAGNYIQTVYSLGYRLRIPNDE